jgi:rhodanese-related sulfurtransferase
MSFWGHEEVVLIDANSAAQEVEQGAQLVDIGQPDEWFEGHLPRAILIEPDLLDQELHRLSKDRPVIVASRSVDLSEGVAASLQDHGFDAAMLEGGIGAWKAAGHKLVKADGSPA